MDPVTDSGGRVTRSLRKRISSVDGDNSSRPGTPVPSKLISITEISSPSRPARISRRNSTSGVSTPIKTPAKRTTTIISETAEPVTPSRRTTRRRSVSINENEGTPQIGLKAPKVESLPEESVASVKEIGEKTVTRTQLKSPEQSTTSLKESEVRRKPGPKCMTQPLSDEDSDVEVIVDEKEAKNVNISQINITTIDLIDCDDESQSVEKTVKDSDKTQPENVASKSSSQSSESQTVIDNLDVQKSKNTALEREVKDVNKENSNNNNNTTIVDLMDKTKHANKNEIDSDKTMHDIKESVKSGQMKISEIKSNSIDINKLNTITNDGGILNKENLSENNVSIVDLMDCDDEPQQLDNAKLVRENKEFVASTNSPKITLSEPNSEKINVAQTDKITAQSGEPSAPDVKSTTEETPKLDSSLDKNQKSNVRKSEVIETSKIESTLDKNKKSSVRKSEVTETPETDSTLDKNEKSIVRKSELTETPKTDSTLDKNEKTNVGKSEVIQTSKLDSTLDKNEKTNVGKSEVIPTSKLDSILDKNEKSNVQKSEVIATSKLNSTLDKNEKSNVRKSEVTETHKTDSTLDKNENTNIRKSEEIDSENFKKNTSQHNEPELNFKPDKTTDVIVKDVEDEILHSDNNDPSDKSASILEIDETTIEPKLNVSEKGVSRNDLCLTPQTQRKSTATIIEVINISCALTPTRLDISASGCKSSKKVEFISSPSGDSAIKSVYPKTPALMKTKSFIEKESSFQVEKVLNFKDVSNVDECEQDDDEIANEIQSMVENNEMDIDDDDDDNIEDEHQTDLKEQTKTPPRIFKSAHQLKNAQSSTPIVVDVSKIENDFKELSKDKSEERKSPKEKFSQTSNKKESSINDKEKIHSKEMQNENTELKWINPSVKGNTGEGCKLDGVKQSQTPKICSTTNVQKLIKEDKSDHKIKKSNQIVFSSESNDEEEDEELDEEEEEVELAEGEKPYKRKHVFHDDEAVEVDDYESGDSMDSEEREEMLENEIPVDGESIGSNTTDEEHDDDDYADEEDGDSFIVSDNDGEEDEPLECTDSDDEDDLVENHDRKKKKSYKRIQRPPDNSSSSEEEDDTDMKTKLNKNDSSKDMNISIAKSSDKNVLDSSKLSDTALRLHCNTESESDEALDDVNSNASRKEILRKLNQSDRFNKSVRDLNMEIDTSSPVEVHSERDKSAHTELATDTNNDKDEKIMTEDVEHRAELEQEESSADELNSSDTNVDKKLVSHLGEVSVTTESDNDKENNENNNKLSTRIQSGGLSVSFGNFKPKKHSAERSEWQRSFTIGVSVKGANVIDAAVTENKLKNVISSSSSPPSSSAVDQNDELSSDDARYLENIKHMPLPLGNPLVRTRRQSLALPTNPNMEICPLSSHCGNNKKPKRKSVGMLSSNEFNPSQSFIDSVQLRKNEFDRQAASKRKRLSKSFCGASDTLDNSIIDIDVRHLHKRSKLDVNNSIMEENVHDSIENIDTSKLHSKVNVSSTPHEKHSKNDSNNNIQRILSRCDEILEAANRAKFEAKINNKKSKVKLPKKNRKKTAQQEIRELHQDDGDEQAKLISKGNKNKTRAALTQAFKAADVIIGKKKHNKQPKTCCHIDHDAKVSTPPPSRDILKTISESVPVVKKIKKDKNNDQLPSYNTTSTTSGNFIEMPQTPERKNKKAKIIQLPTGKVCVEPVTPKKHSVLACDGTKFRESPIPIAVGFRVCEIPCVRQVGQHELILKNRKRKRTFDEPSKNNFPKPQWTQSGLFMEEEIPSMRQIARSEASHKLKKSQNEEQTAAYWNFKQNAIMRSDIKRGSTRELLQLKERRQIQNQFY